MEVKKKNPRKEKKRKEIQGKQPEQNKETNRKTKEKKEVQRRVQSRNIIH